MGFISPIIFLYKISLCSAVMSSCNSHTFPVEHTEPEPPVHHKEPLSLHLTQLATHGAQQLVNVSFNNSGQRLHFWLWWLLQPWVATAMFCVIWLQLERGHRLYMLSSSSFSSKSWISTKLMNNVHFSDCASAGYIYYTSVLAIFCFKSCFIL